MTSAVSKNPLEHLHHSDLRSLAQLATQATTGVIRITEGVHQSVWNTLGVAGKTPGRTGGITGLVYRSVHGVTLLVGKAIDTALSGLEALVESAEDAKPGTPQREALLAAINGVIGDRLVAQSSPLATPMTVRYRGEALSWRALPPMPAATGKVLLLIHGLCMNDFQWRTSHQGRTVDHGQKLASALGYTPVYLRYNSGLHTSRNGRELSAQLERLVTHWPTQIEELTIVAHSMGGLLARGAFHHARKNVLRWPDHLKNMVFLGTPHHGAPLERASNWLDVILAGTPHTAPFRQISQLRSAGITDLRHGHVVDEDWHGQDRFHRQGDRRRAVPLPEGVACFAVAATTANKRGVLADRLVGDGLVPLRSALGQHDDARRRLRFTKTSQWIAYGMNHIELLSSPEVARQIVQWLAPPEPRNEETRP